MRGLRTLIVTATPLMIGVALLLGGALAQSAQDYVGTWKLISNDTVRPDGSKVPTFGGDATGVLVFGNDGRFIYIFSRADLPKFASNNRNTGTQEENTAIVKGSIATSGTYSVAGKTFTIKVEHSTFPNWIGTEQTRTVAVAGDDMKWTNPAGSGGGVAELTFKRMK